MELCKKNLITDLKIIKSNFQFISKKAQKLQMEIEPKNADNKKLHYKSTNPKVAIVSSSGTITPISKGTCYVDIASTDGSNITKRITVNVDLDYTNGDYNNDKELNVTDAYGLLTAISKGKPIENQVKEIVDMNIDEKIDVTDAYLLLKLISEMI